MDYAQKLKNWRCWDLEADNNWYAHSRLYDGILQNPQELIALCQWMESKDIQSYLEIGIWTGKLLCFLHEVFQFKTLAACDIGVSVLNGYEILVPQQTQILPTFSHSPAFLQWRTQLGQIDLVMIDGDHSYEGVKRDFLINRQFPHRFLVFHDIHNSDEAGLVQFWQELKGNKREIYFPDLTLRARMGIGIWSESESV